MESYNLRFERSSAVVFFYLYRGKSKALKDLNRKPKYVEIPTVPRPTAHEAASYKSESLLEHYENRNATKLGNSNPQLMDKLGSTNNSTLVKTTTHVHPIMKNLPIGAKSQNEGKKKSTTSPASTLSDKGIGSSVGSFDSEYRHGASVSYASNITYDPSKTGSLDSRTQETNEKPYPVHTRSSSDIICRTATGDTIGRSRLAEQSRAPLWNHDPRRISRHGVESATLNSSARSLKGSFKKSKPSFNSKSVEEDPAIRKLPQLYSYVQPNGPYTQVNISGHPNIGMDRSREYFNGHVNNSNPLAYNFAPPLNENAPPLPPKASHIRTSSQLSNPENPPIHQGHTEQYHLYQNNNTMLSNPNYQNISFPPHRISQAPMGIPMQMNSERTLQQAQSTYNQNNPHLWSGDARRPAPVSLDQGLPLSHPSMGVGFNKAESIGRLALPKNPSNSSFIDNNLALNSSFAGSDHSSVHSDDMFKRQAAPRSSSRCISGESRRPSYVINQGNPTLRPIEGPLQPLNFDLPHAVVSETKFVGRDWLFNALNNIFASKDAINNKVAIITGKKASGKTAVMEQLAAFSYRGRNSGKRFEIDTLTRGPPPMYRSSSPLNRSIYSQYHPGSSNHSSRTGSPSPSLASGGSNRTGSQISLTDDSCRKVASQVVAFHFCQADHNITTFLPEFLFGVAAQLSSAPHLTSYRELIMSDPKIGSLLTIENCVQNPTQVLYKAILDPLTVLRQSQKLPKSNIIILIDAINESEQYVSDFGYSIRSFLKEHLPNFPDFVKVVMTCRTEDKNLVSDFPGKFVSLDGDDNQFMSRDMQLYISHRISMSTVLSSLTLSGKADTAVAHKQLSQHLIKTADGNFLYLRLILDLIDNGSLIPKSAGFTTFPRNLHEVFLLLCNLKFHSYTSFDDVRDIISVALASLYPLSDEVLHKVVVSVLPPNTMTFPVFREQMKILDELLVLHSSSGKRSFFHPTFREWLKGDILPANGNGTLQSSNRFKVDIKRGNYLLGTFLSLLPPEQLRKHATLEMAHHVLKASSLFKSQSNQAGSNSADFNAKFMAKHSNELTAALVSTRNLLYPTIKMCKLLLAAGANSNCDSEIFCNAPSLAVAAHTGCIQLAELLLMHQADVNRPAANGMTPLAFASASGVLEMVQLLLRYGPSLDFYDHNGHTPLLHALARNHSTVAKLLLSPDFYIHPQNRMMAAQRALVAAATTGNIEFIDYLLQNREFHCDVNNIEPLRGETPLTSAAARGRFSVCEFLIKHCGAKIYLQNRDGLTPLLSAVRHGDFETVVTLLDYGAAIEPCDKSGKTPLMSAALRGHLGLLEFLITRGANVNATDEQNMTAFLWAVWKGHIQCVQTLIGRSNVHHYDVHGRNALHLAAITGDLQIMEILLNSGVDVDLADVSGITPLDCAIEKQHTAMVTRLVELGAPIQSTSWNMAVGNQEMIKLLLSSSHAQATDAYKQASYNHSHDICKHALRHMGELPPEGTKYPQHPSEIAELCAEIQLCYSKCLRKLDSLKEAYTAASRALELKPHWYEASFVRSRVLRDQSNLEAALRDVIDAERYAPIHNVKDVRRSIDKIKEEIRLSCSRNQRSSVSSEINIQRSRPRLNSSSSYHGHPTHTRSPSPPAADLSRSHHSGSFCGPNTMNNDTPRMIRVNSEDSLTTSMVDMSLQHHNVRPNNTSNVRRTPSAKTHWKPHVADLNRSLSTGPQVAAFNHSRPARPSEQAHFAPYNNHIRSHGELAKGALVTDL